MHMNNLRALISRTGDNWADIEGSQGTRSAIIRPRRLDLGFAFLGTVPYLL